MSSGEEAEAVAEYEPEDLSTEEDLENSLLTKRDLIRWRLARLERDNEKFADVADQLNDLVFERGESGNLYGAEEEDEDDNYLGRNYEPYLDHGNQPKQEAASDDAFDASEEGDRISFEEKGDLAASRRRQSARYDVEPQLVPTTSSERRYANAAPEREERKLRKELLKIKEALSFKEEQYRSQERRAKRMESRIADLERELREYKAHYGEVSRASSESTRRSSAPRHPPFHDTMPPPTYDMKAPRNMESAAQAASVLLHESQGAERYMRTVANGLRHPVASSSISVRRRPPFISGGSTSKTINQNVPITVHDRQAKRLQRLREEKRILTEEYRAILRSGLASGDEGSVRLRDLLTLIEEKERKVRKLCSTI